MKLSAHIFINGWSAARDVKIDMPDKFEISEEYPSEVTVMIELPDGTRLFTTGKGVPLT